MSPFDIRWFWNALYGVVALLLSAALTLGVTAWLVWVIDVDLLGDVRRAKEWSTLQAPGPEGTPSSPDIQFSALEAHCQISGDAAWDLNRLELALRRAEAAEAPAPALFEVICQAMASFRLAAALGSGEVPLIRPMAGEAAPRSAETGVGDNVVADRRTATTDSDASDDDQSGDGARERPLASRIRVVAMASCDEQLTDHYQGDDLDGVPDLGWYPPYCILERVRSVRPRALDDPWRLALQDDAATSGVEGTIYVFRHPRLRTAYQDPNALHWTKEEATPTPDEEARRRALTILSRALNRLDKLLLPRIRVIEREYWLPRFILRSLANAFQFVIFAFGMWAAVLYLHMMAQARWGSATAAQLAAAILAEVPGGIPTAPASPLWSTLPFSSEMRNAADGLSTSATYRGKAWADTLSEWVPTLGFIGTVVGMIGAMDAVGAVVAADPGPELFTAMSGVTSELSLAFYTTFISLTVGLVLAWLRRHAIAAEFDAVAAAVRLARD